MQAFKPLHADDDRRRRRPRRVDEDGVRGRRRSSRRTHAGRNIAFGIREHAMGSIVNGIALHGGMLEAVRLDVPHLLRLHAAGRPALGARRSCQSLWVWTHDSVGARRGRADAPAGRALRGAARDPEPLVRAARRTRTRRGGVEGRARARGRPGRRSRSRARSCRRSTAPRSRRPRASRAARTRSGSRATASPT